MRKKWAVVWQENGVWNEIRFESKQSAYDNYHQLKKSHNRVALWEQTKLEEA